MRVYSVCILSYVNCKSMHKGCLLLACVYGLERNRGFRNLCLFLCFCSVEEICFTKELSEIKITEANMTATFECELSKEGLKVDWSKNGKTLRRGDKFDISTDGKIQRLVIENVTAEEAGKYTASYQHLETTAALIVNIAPKISTENLQEKIVMKAGTSTVIEIPFSGSPQPDAKWTFKGGKLPDVRRFKVDTIHGMTSLAISKAVRSDSGKYTLALENKYGKATFTVELVVLGKYLSVILIRFNVE